MLFSKTTVFAYGFAGYASAHMLLANPQPYDTPHLRNGPLSADGSDFPCQAGGGPLVAGSASNTIALGSSHPLSFTGQATHGGGSCQVSITYDANPGKNSVFRVIHSIEGGCPARGEAGNMGGNAEAADPYLYNFTVPSNIPTGQVTLAWTWFNKIGNREMYMNCAPVTLTGTGGDKSNFDKLPEIFKANIGNGCSTEDSKDVLFPNPGDSVEQLNGATSAFASPVGACGPTGAPGAGGSGGSGGSGSGSGAQATATVPGGVFATAPAGGSGSGSGSGSDTNAPPATTAAVAPSPTATPASFGSGSGSGAGTNGGGAGTNGGAGGGNTGASGSHAPGSPCSPDGLWNCLGSSYQQCGSGLWSPVMSLAAGTSCTPGEGASINIVAAGRKERRVAVRFHG